MQSIYIAAVFKEGIYISRKVSLATFTFYLNVIDLIFCSY